MGKNTKTIICITGMPGAGKTTVNEIIKKKFNLPIIVMGDVIREEAKIRGIPQTSENLSLLMLKMRKEMGANIVALKCIETMKNIESDFIVIEGVRNLEEVEEFKKLGKVIVIVVHSSPRTRFQRLTSRGRSDDPKTWEEFCLRDLRELDIGIGKVIALADEVIVNEENIENLEKEAIKVISKVMGYGC
ncbi:MAG: AAA family ATPase [Candidatus Methanomethylicia archaeon]|nr:AAA family ATPase [Candidatus Methanomethylicia archaeon]MCX8169010.1 AAA family ATPase [Candidatus Methanomethylicia archaeon]MDW7988742.1 AAA family ATPase [Nitrososphaerota archaeon]